MPTCQEPNCCSLSAVYLLCILKSAPIYIILANRFIHKVDLMAPSRVPNIKYCICLESSFRVASNEILSSSGGLLILVVVLQSDCFYLALQLLGLLKEQCWGLRHRFVETKRYMDFMNPGSQSAEGTFLGLEPALEGLEIGYPGGPLFNPVGLARDVSKSQPLKLKEIKNGRLAMVAMVGIAVQASITHTGPINNLVAHLSNPWHNTVVQTLANLGP
eukprot:Gb_25594 [translate_table: standard]